jgi:rubredoxin
MTNRFLRKPRKCPNCGDSPVAYILYGMPAYDEKMQKELDAGRLALGGCCIGMDDPAWKCSGCGLEMYKKQLEIPD